METVTVIAEAYDGYSGLSIKGSSSQKKFEKSRLTQFGVSSHYELEDELEKMEKGESNISNYDYRYLTFDLLEVIDVPDNMKEKEYLLFDVCNVIDGWETTTTHLSFKLGFNALNEAMDDSKSWNKDDEEDLLEAYNGNFWNEERKELNDSGNLIIIKNVRDITQQQAVLFKLVNNL